jgi:hypothetical protein
MTRLLPLVLPALLLGSLVTFAPRASACDGGFGYGWGMGQLYNSLEYRVPYFAAHPPVYYSYPVPRTYGHSPFAYPPHFRTPEVVAEPVALEISNPYVTPASSTEAAPERSVEAAPSAPQPLVVINPYVTQGVELAQTGE